MTNIIKTLDTSSRVDECLHCQLRDVLNDYYDQHGVVDVRHALKHLSMLAGELISSGPDEGFRNDTIAEFSDALHEHVRYLISIGAQPPGVLVS